MGLKSFRGSLKAPRQSSKWHCYNKASYLEYIEFITEDYFPKHTNITTKLKWKVFTNVIREPSKEAWHFLDRKV
jgi:hypothetical protein